MQQQVQTNQPAAQVLSDAAAFFAKRRAKITNRTERGFRFGLEGGNESEGGRVTVASGSGGVSTVTVQADGLGVLAMAEGFVRELRKQARGAGRQARPEPEGTLRGGFGDLRRRLGMPEPVAPRPVPPRPAGPVRRPVGVPGPESAGEPSEPQRVEMAGGVEVSTAPDALTDRHAEPDGPTPAEAHAVSPRSGPRSAPAPVPPAPSEAPHPSFAGPSVPAAGAAEAPPATHALSNAGASAEQLGGVPHASQVTVRGTPDAAAAAAPAGPEAPDQAAARREDMAAGGGAGNSPEAPPAGDLAAPPGRPRDAQG